MPCLLPPIAGQRLAISRSAYPNPRSSGGVEVCSTAQKVVNIEYHKRRPENGTDNLCV